MEALNIRQPHTCSVCGREGHNSRRCPDAGDESARTERDIRMTRIADMRMECDALATEITEYERVWETLGERIATDKRRIVDLQVAIAKLRSAQ